MTLSPRIRTGALLLALTMPKSGLKLKKKEEKVPDLLQIFYSYRHEYDKRKKKERERASAGLMRKSERKLRQSAAHETERVFMLALKSFFFLFFLHYARLCKKCLSFFVALHVKLPK